MKPTILSILLLLICSFQPKPIVIKLDKAPELFTVDNLGNCYVYHNYQVNKYSAQGKLVAKFSSFNYGKLESIDASDPMHILLFYKDFNSLLFLDNRLSPKGSSINLNELRINSATVDCKSKQMAVWIFDEYENKLYHFGFNPRGIIQTINLDNLSIQLSDINFMLENGNELYMNQQNKTIWVFDQFGRKLDKHDIQLEKGFQIANKRILYNNGFKLYSINLINPNISSIKVDYFKEFDDARISNNNIYILNNDSITIMEQPKYVPNN